MPLGMETETVVNPIVRILEFLYRKGCQSRANQHRLVTAFSLHGDDVPAATLLEAAFDAFRPGDEKHPANLAYWWGGGRLRIELLQLWAGGEPDDQGVYTWHAPTAKTLVHYYDLATAFGHVRFAGSVERATDPKAENPDVLESVVRMGDRRDRALYGPGGVMPERAKGLVTDVEGQQSWRFSIVGSGLRVEHESQGRRLAKDAALFAVLGPIVGWLFRLVHDLEMRRGLRTLPDYLSGTGSFERDVPNDRSNPLHGQEIRLRIEEPRWPEWLDRIFGYD